VIGAYLALAGAVVIEVASTLGLQASDGFRRRVWTAPVVLGYAVSYALLSVSLAAGMPLGVAYGLWTAVGVAATAMLAHRLFREPFTRLMGLGVVVIVGGVLLVELGHAR